MSHYNDLFEKAKAYGVADVPRDQSLCFRVYLDRTTPYTIQTSSQPTDARWSGGSLVVQMENGDKRIYNELSSGGYQTIYA
jgi:hypothetical protein